MWKQLGSTLIPQTRMGMPVHRCCSVLNFRPLQELLN